MKSAKIENIVASTTLAKSLDLNKVVLLLEAAEYEPEKFPGLIYRLKDMGTAILLFHSGKANCTGGKTLDDVKRSIDLVLKKLRDAGIDVYDEPEIKVQNIVSVFDLERDLNLTTVAVGLGLERVEYEPEQFPGLVYRLTDPKVVLLVFGSGKVVCTGATNREDIDRAVERLTKDIEKSLS